MGDPMELDEKPRLRGRRSRLGAADGDEEEEDQLNEEFGMPHFSALEKDHAIGIDIGTLYKKLKNGDIDLNAEYQRGVTWQAARQTGLIDSIQRQRFVPPLLFHVVERPGQVDQWTCIDGKQRLTSVEKFMDGLVPCRDSDNIDWWYKRTTASKPRHHIFPRQARRDFRAKKLDVTLFKNLTDEDERDVFRCVQEGVPLTTGEKIQAIGGPYGTFIEELRQRYFEGTREDGSDGLDGRVLQCVRGKGSEIVACMFRLVEDLVNSREPNLVQPAAFLKELGRRNAEGPVPGKLKARAIQLLDRFMRLSLIPPTKKIELGSKTAREKMEQMIPAHQVFLGPVVSGRTPSGLNTKPKGTWMSPVEMTWLIHILDACDDRPDGEVLEIIEIFKNDIRREFPNEVKLNSKVVAWIKDWVADTRHRPVSGKYMVNDQAEEVVHTSPRRPPAVTVLEGASSRTSPHKRSRADSDGIAIDPRLTPRSPAKAQAGPSRPALKVSGLAPQEPIASTSAAPAQPTANRVAFAPAGPSAPMPAVPQVPSLSSTAPGDRPPDPAPAPAPAPKRAFQLPARLRAANAKPAPAPPLESMSPARPAAPQSNGLHRPPPGDPRLQIIHGPGHSSANANRAPTWATSGIALPSFKKIKTEDPPPPPQPYQLPPSAAPPAPYHY